MRRWTVERDAVILAKGRVYTVVSTQDADPLATPTSWPERWRNNAVKAELRAHDDQEAVYEAVLPREPSWPRGVVTVLAPPDDEGHYPSCSKCGDPWPCGEVEVIRNADRQADRMLSSIEYEADHPWPCAWCGKFSPHTQRPRRFKTERGMKQHLRQCRDNPKTWDASVWLHLFNDDLTIRGGVTPDYLTRNPDTDPASAHAMFGIRFGDINELVAINLAVKRAALDGTLPARLDELEIDL